MARHFDESFFRSLDRSLRGRLIRVIASGLEHPDSRIGAYAMSPDDYDLFAPMLEPIIRDFHGIATGRQIAQDHDWESVATIADDPKTAADLENASLRIRVARNVGQLPLPGAMSLAQRMELEDRGSRALAALNDDLALDGRYCSLTPGSAYEMDAREQARRVAAHQMFSDTRRDPYLNGAGFASDWPSGRGLFLSRDERVLVWVGEEDHFRVMVMQCGGGPRRAMGRLRTVLQSLQDQLGDCFARSPRYGYVSSCPSNLGTGMRASLHLRLPRLTSDGHDLTRLKREAVSLGLAVRGADGEHTHAGADGLVDISPRIRLGVTEAEIVSRLYEGGVALLEREESR